MALAKTTLERLARFDTPTISNVIELFGIRPRNTGFMDGRIKAGFPELPPMVGFAATAAFRSGSPPAAGDAYGSVAKQLDRFARLPGPAVVVFQDLDDPPVGATFGEMMCSTYQAFGSTGLITSGGGRDLEQVRAIRYPVFTGSTICAPRLLPHFAPRTAGPRRFAGRQRGRPSARRRQRSSEHTDRDRRQGGRRRAGVRRRRRHFAGVLSRRPEPKTPRGSPRPNGRASRRSASSASGCCRFRCVLARTETVRE